MPRDGSGVYSPDWVNAAPNVTIESAKQNAMVADLVADANAARPITAGGTGETTARLKDGTWRFENTADPTKLLAFDLSGLTTATTRTQIAPDENGRQALAAHLSGHLYGLTLSNNGTDATNDIDIATGNAIDSTNTHVMTLASALTKRLDAAWAVGNGNGGLDTGTIANATYHIHLIKRVDTGVVDALFSISPSAPTMPASYTLSRRIGSIIRSSAAILGFTQRGNRFLLSVPVVAASTAGPGTSAVYPVLEVPGAIQTQALVSASVIWSAAGSAGSIAALISSPSQTDTAPAAGGIGNIQILAKGATQSVSLPVLTNTSRQIRYRLSGSEAAVTVLISSDGWIDDRGTSAAD